MCGFANPISFKNITDGHIRQVESFIKGKCLIILQNRLSESFGEECDALVAENDMQDHFGMYADGDVSLFEFQAGDVVLIKELVHHVNRIINEKGLHHFRKRLATQKVAEVKPMKNTIEIVDLKSQLLQKVIALFAAANQLNDTTFAIEEINEDFVSIHNDDGRQIHGEIVCIACNIDRKEKSKPKKISYNIDRNGNGCWVMSNFKKHLERSHHLIIEKKRLAKVRAKLSDGHTDVVDGSQCSDHKIDLNGTEPNNIPNVPDNVENGTRNTDHKIDSNGNDTEPTMIQNVPDDFNDDGHTSVEITNDEDLRRIEEADNDTQATLLNQLSKQTTDVLASTLNHNDQQEEMDFVLGKSPRKITVAKVPKDNNCIFGALAHQLWMNKLSSKQQKTAAKKLRAEVVEHILKPENFPMFQLELQDYIHELKTPNEITDLAAECKLYVRHKLSKDKEWGGAEVLLAVSNIYSTNVIVFYEDDSCQKIKAAGKNYGRSIAVAHRLSVDKKTRNHYDSVCDIPSDNLLAAVRKLAKKM